MNSTQGSNYRTLHAVINQQSIDQEQEQVQTQSKFARWMVTVFSTISRIFFTRPRVLAPCITNNRVIRKNPPPITEQNLVGLESLLLNKQSVVAKRIYKTIKKTGNINARPISDLDDDLKKAIKNNNKSEICSLKSQGADHDNCFQFAIKTDNKALVDLLIKLDADIEVTDAFENSLLHLAVDCHKSMVEILLNAGVNPKAINCYGDNPLHVNAKKIAEYYFYENSMVFSISKKIAFLLINQDVNILFAKNNKGETPLQIILAENDNTRCNHFYYVQDCIIPLISHFFILTIEQNRGIISADQVIDNLANFEQLFPCKATMIQNLENIYSKILNPDYNYTPTVFDKKTIAMMRGIGIITKDKHVKMTNKILGFDPSPQSINLQKICKDTIIQQLNSSTNKQSLAQKIDSLPIPKQLKKFVEFHYVKLA